MKEALKSISDLVERFQRNIEAYHSPAYNETQLRREFIDPFFEALGWDVANKEGHAEQYKDVIHEDTIKVAGATKARGGYFSYESRFIRNLPIRTINLSDQKDQARHDRIVRWWSKCSHFISS
jgi:hypothetical protein